MWIREARAADAPQIARVHVDSWRTTYAGIVPADFLMGMSYEDFEARWCGWMSEPRGRGIFHVAELPSGRIVGFASGGPRREDLYSEYEGELYTAYLLREHQRKGLGRRLISTVADGLAVQGKRSMLAWVLAGNPSRPFYDAMGGKLLGSQEIEIGGVMLEEVAYGWDDVRPLAVFAERNFERGSHPSDSD
jgi:L-amino acid N-acyltransferase YncA